MRPNEIGVPGSPVYGFVNLLLSRSMLDCFQDGRRVYLARRLISSALPIRSSPTRGTGKAGAFDDAGEGAEEIDTVQGGELDRLSVVSDR